jgi:hypothetical protein
VLLWVSIAGGVALCALLLALWSAMRRSERRARAAVFKALGVSDEMIATLRNHSRSIAEDLTVLRSSIGSPGGASNDAEERAAAEAQIATPTQQRPARRAYRSDRPRLRGRARPSRGQPRRPPRRGRNDPTDS